MQNKSNTKFRHLGLILFFVINLLANYSKADEHIYSKIDYLHNSSPSCIELIIASKHINFSIWNCHNGYVTNYSTAAAQPPIFNSFVLLDYERSVIQKLKTQTANNTLHKNLISILQKKNTRHQSEKSDPPLS
jgi:hypothetical protein